MVFPTSEVFLLPKGICFTVSPNDFFVSEFWQMMKNKWQKFHIFQRTASIECDLPWNNVNKTCWASSSFRVHDSWWFKRIFRGGVTGMIFAIYLLELSYKLVLACFYHILCKFGSGPQKWSPSDVHQSTSSVPICSISHTSSYDVLVRIIEDLSFCGWKLWDLQ